MFFARTTFADFSILYKIPLSFTKHFDRKKLFASETIQLLGNHFHQFNFHQTHNVCRKAHAKTKRTLNIRSDDNASDDVLFRFNQSAFSFVYL